MHSGTCWNSTMAGHLRQDVFSPLRGNRIAAAFTGSPGTTFHGILAEKVLHRGKKKSLEVQFVVFSTQSEITTSWS